ncbi:LOW QUALITY PROTEIN: conserved oligomeric Golgi complex subunit 4 [Choristoneura fumiferana]|uniref:LOW QUALITY PROTEIN: conserved oligomeric Golgi complex subunit 4 n=1 Tax=Choristoneura fumiferana TaxID=7141 RepID=UPI003D156D72
MSLTLLLEKYDVSTEEGLKKALSEIEQEETEVDEALATVMSKACTLEGRLRTASQAYGKLGEVKGDTQVAADMVDRTAMLARDVSAKVRQLDLARSRVAECQRRVHDLIDLQLCSAGVEAAIKAHDYETGATHVARFLSMDPGSVAAARARGAPDPRDAMTAAANTLRDHLVRKFEEAARKDDEAAVERLFKLFPQIGRADEGVDLLAKYLANKADYTIRRACVVSEPNSEAAVFADAFTRVLEAGGLCVERARRLAAQRAPGKLPRALAVLQPVICSGARRVYLELSAARLGAGAGRGRGRRGAARRSALQAEPALAELALAHSTIQLYFTFLRRRAEADAATLDEATKKSCIAAVEKIIADCDLMRTAQDLLGHYLTLERFFLEESVGKALKMAAPQVGATGSSLVDDVFFIARKVIRRSISTGSVDGACAVLNEVAALMERDAAGALRRWLRAPPPDPLPLAAPRAPPAPRPAPLDAPAQLYIVILYDGCARRRPTRCRWPPPAPPAPRPAPLDAPAQLYIAHLNEAEAGGEWSMRLASEACTLAEPLFLCSTGRDKLVSCASSLSGAAAAFRAARDLALQGVAAALKHKVAAWAQALADPGPGDAADAMEDDADALPAALDTLAEAARAHLSAASSAQLLATLVTDLATRAEDRMLQHHYDQESGMVVERRARRLAAWAGAAAAGARERCARLSQAAALLAGEQCRPVQHARLPPARQQQLLARRTDFKMEDIKRLRI